jgi:hypothetical protein
MALGMLEWMLSLADSRGGAEPLKLERRRRPGESGELAALIANAIMGGI